MKSNKTTCCLSLTALMVFLFTFSAKGQIQIMPGGKKDAYDFKALVYSGTDRSHNPVIPDAINGIEYLSRKYQFKMDWTLQEAVFGSEDLFTYDVVVFLNTNARKLTAEQRENFRKFINQGGGFVGIHAIDGMEDWEWFNKLVGRIFDFHPPIQSAVMDVIDKNFPATMHLPDRILWTDQWYSFGEALTDDQHVLITVDESSYKPEDNGKLGMGDFHPICWYQKFDGGRSFYTAIGHYKELYQDQDFMLHIYGGMLWAATGKGISSK